MDSAESIMATIKNAITFAEKMESTIPEKVEVFGALIRAAYEKGREDVHQGLSSPILGMNFITDKISI